MLGLVCDDCTDSENDNSCRVVLELDDDDDDINNGEEEESIDDGSLADILGVDVGESANVQGKEVLMNME